MTPLPQIAGSVLVLVEDEVDEEVIGGAQPEALQASQQLV
jgi:hypothetical protein